jgi:hypothetical protein
MLFDCTPAWPTQPAMTYAGARHQGLEHLGEQVDRVDPGQRATRLAAPDR